MAKHYTRIDGDIYVYVTKNDPMVDLSLFPPELGLFESEDQVRMSEKMAVITEASEKNGDKVEIILSLNGFRRKDLPRDVLEHFFDSGDESIIEAGETPPQAGGDADEEEDESPEIDVIIPRAVSPTEIGVDNSEEKGEDKKAGARMPLESDRAVGTSPGRRPASDDELIDSLVLWMRNQGIEVVKEREPKAGPVTTAQDELLREIASHVRSITPKPGEAEWRKTDNEGLLEQLSGMLKGGPRSPEEEIRRPPQKGAFSIEEEIDRHLVDYVKSRFPLRRVGEDQTPQTWIEEELDRHIAEYMKSRMPIKRPDSKEAETGEASRGLNILGLGEETTTVKVREEGHYSPWLVERLEEHPKKEKRESS